jgi:hypothetical protein
MVNNDDIEFDRSKPISLYDTSFRKNYLKKSKPVNGKGARKYPLR